MHDCCDIGRAPRAHSRRAFMKTVALGSGVAMMLGTRAFASGNVDALLLTCMDYRLENEILAYMDGRGLRDKYDHVVLAGASLGVLTDQKPDWAPTFWQHLDISIQLHHVHEVMVLDHRDCGAYKTFLGEDFAKDPAKELAVHTDYLKRLKAQIAERHDSIGVELGLMALDGSVQTIA